MLLVAPSITAAAKMAGVSRRALGQWLQDAQFRAVLRSATAEALNTTTRRLTSLSGSAVDVLDAAMGDDVKIETRVRAADITLGKLLQLGELHDVVQRVQALEAAQGASK